MKKLVYKSYKVFSYRFYSSVTININSDGILTVSVILIGKLLGIMKLEKLPTLPEDS